MILQIFIAQLASYGFAPWLLFASITIACAYLLGQSGILLGQLLVAMAVIFFDVRWIQSEMRNPDWDGVPDQDIIFYIGVLLRIVMINATLLPASILVVVLRRPSKASAQKSDQTPQL